MMPTVEGYADFVNDEAGPGRVASGPGELPCRGWDQIQVPAGITVFFGITTIPSRI